MMHIWYGARRAGHRTSSEEDSTSTDAASRRVVPMPKQSICSGLKTYHNVQLLLLLCGITPAQPIPGIPTHFSVASSVCLIVYRLSHSYLRNFILATVDAKIV